jgi:hypothetical protein
LTIKHHVEQLKCFLSSLFIAETPETVLYETTSGVKPNSGIVCVTEPPNYDGPQVHVIAIMTSDSRTYVHHNFKGLLSSEQDPITGVLQYYNSLFKIFNRVK